MDKYKFDFAIQFVVKKSLSFFSKCNDGFPIKGKYKKIGRILCSSFRLRTGFLSLLVCLESKNFRI